MSDPLYDEDSFPEKPIPSEEELEGFRQQVSEWLKLDEQVRKLQIAIRERKVHQRALSSQVQQFMKRFGYDNLNTQQGRIKSSVRTVKEPIKLSEVKTKLLELGSEKISGEELIERIFNAERPTSTKESLRRIVPKVSLQLDI